MRFAEALECFEPGDSLTLTSGDREGELEVVHSRRRSSVWHEVVTDSNTRLHVVRSRWVFITDDALERLPGVDDTLPAVMSLMDAEYSGDKLVVADVDAEDFDREDLERAGVLG